MSSITLQKCIAYGVNKAEIMERFLNDEKLYTECVNMFLADSGVSRLDNAMKSGDIHAAFEEIHNIKGVTGNLGLKSLYEAASALTEALRAGNAEKGKKLYGDFINRMTAFTEAMN